MKSMKIIKIAALGLTTLLFAINGATYAGADGGSEGITGKKMASKEIYPLDVCPISGEKLGVMGKPAVRSYDGREVRFCCESCIEGFEENLDANLKKMDEAIIAKLKPGYPLETCLVSGEKLGEMGEPVDYVYDNQLIRLCCQSCIETFEEDPDNYLKKLQAAYTARGEGKEMAMPEAGCICKNHEDQNGHKDHESHEDHEGH